MKSADALKDKYNSGEYCKTFYTLNNFLIHDF